MANLHYTQISRLVEKKDGNGNLVPFSITYIKRSTGERIIMDNVVCTSSHHRPVSINVKSNTSEEIRKLRAILVEQINSTKIFV